LRLAFSVVINMNPRILLADEILAVGDAAFKESCQQKVAELA
jgi:ABC-type polysaccharide/polyol phosphate transport system ATPase subunit